MLPNVTYASQRSRGLQYGNNLARGYPASTAHLAVTCASTARLFLRCLRFDYAQVALVNTRQLNVSTAPTPAAPAPVYPDESLAG